MRSLGRWCAAAGVRVISACFCALPRRWAHAVGRYLGGRAYRYARRERRVALENVRLALGLEGQEAEHVARAAFKVAGATIVDLLRAPRFTMDRFRRDIEIDPSAQRALASVLSAERGAIFAVSHCGNWELLNLAFPLLDAGACKVIARPFPNPRLTKVFTRLRGATGQEVIHRWAAAIHCLRGLRKGVHAAIVVDVAVPPEAGAVLVDFFGIPAYTTNLIGMLAAKTGAPVYLSWMEPLVGARYRLVARGPIPVPEQGDTHERALAVTQAVIGELEAAVRAKPEIWAWWMKRWRIRPADATVTYPSYATDERWLWPAGAGPRRDGEPA